MSERESQSLENEQQTMTSNRSQLFERACGPSPKVELQGLLDNRARSLSVRISTSTHTERTENLLGRELGKEAASRPRDAIEIGRSGRNR